MFARLLLVVAAATLCAAAATAASTQAPIVAVTAESLQTNNQFSLAHLTLDAVATKIGNLTTIGGVLPACSAYDPINNWIITNSLCVGDGSCLTYVDADTGKVAHVVKSGRGWVFSNVEHDTSLKTTFVTGYDERAKTNHVMAVNPLASANSGKQLKTVFQLKAGEIINIDISTMDSVRHIFYFTLQVRVPTFGNALMGVDVTTGTVVSHAVVHNAALTSLLWHDDDARVTSTGDAAVAAAGQLWAFTAQGQNALNFVSLNVATGNVTHTYYSSKTCSNNGMPNLFDPVSRVVYAVCIELNVDKTPGWLSLDLATNKGTFEKLTYYPIDIHWRAAAKSSSSASEEKAEEQLSSTTMMVKPTRGDAEHFTF